LREMDGDRRGLVACFADDDAEGGSSGAARRIGRFLSSGDLRALGKLRYVVAKKAKSGKTHVVTAWTDSSFDLTRLLPSEGDAPGSDADGMPRPVRARRLLTAGIEGVGHGVRIYESAATSKDVLSALDTSMPSLGWERNHAFEVSVPDGRAFSREGRDLLVFTEVDSDQSDRSIISVVDMRAR